MLKGTIGYWVDPPGYFDQIVYPQYLLWNGHILDKTKRDPSIQIMTTDYTSSKVVTTTAILSLVQKYV
jgi:nicotinamide/nicotinate riboside kinase